jgi:hypothetical protein
LNPNGGGDRDALKRFEIWPEWNRPGKRRVGKGCWTGFEMIGKYWVEKKMGK